MKFELTGTEKPKQGSPVVASVDPFDFLDVIEVITGPAGELLQFVSNTSLEKAAELGAASAGKLQLGLWLLVSKGPAVLKGITYLTPGQKQWIEAYHSWLISKGILPPVGSTGPFYGETMSEEYLKSIATAQKIWDAYIQAQAGNIGGGGEFWAIPGWLGDP